MKSRFPLFAVLLLASIAFALTPRCRHIPRGWTTP
jgi:hypothetical protein